MFETNIALEIAKRLASSASSTANGLALEYLVFTNSCDIPKSAVYAGQQYLYPMSQQGTKHMLSLQPNIVRKPVHQLKEEMMERNEGRGYYFLREHIDGMMELSTYRPVDY